MMVGNSLKSDVVPAIEAGSWGVYVPHDLTWVAGACRRARGLPALPAAGASGGADRADCGDRVNADQDELPDASFFVTGSAAASSERVCQATAPCAFESSSA